MKGIKIILIILILFVFLNFIADVKEGKITTKSIFDIKAVQVIGTRVSITIDNGAPNVFISSPLNTTYNYNTSINLNFTVYDTSGVDRIWYNLDNNENNTITTNTTFSTSEGNHTLYFFANDTLGFLNNSKTVVFFINTSKGYNITHTEFTGSTTDFNSLLKSQQSSISNVILHVPSKGKINFNENINISSDTNLDNYIEIGSNSIVLDSNNLPNFNKAATLELYSLTLTNSKIQKDDVDCPSTICKINNYSGGTLNFNVTHFTKYSAAETPTGGGTPGGGTGGTGGGGGGAVTKVDNIKINKDAIKIKLKQDETKSDFLIIENKEDKKIRLTLTVDPEIEFLFIESGISKYSLDIDANDKKNIELQAHAIDIKEGIYVSKLIIESDNFKSVLPVVIEIESKGAALFDVDVEVTNKDKIVEQGDRVTGKIMVFNLGITEEIEAEIEYSILDLDGDAIIDETEKMFIETQFQSIKEFKIPQDTKQGMYIYAVKVSYFDGRQKRVSTSTSLFEVVKKPEAQFPLKIGFNMPFIIIVALLLIIGFFIFYHFEILKVLERLHKRRRKRK